MLGRSSAAAGYRCSFWHLKQGTGAGIAREARGRSWSRSRSRSRSRSSQHLPVVVPLLSSHNRSSGLPSLSLPSSSSSVLHPPPFTRPGYGIRTKNKPCVSPTPTPKHQNQKRRVRERIQKKLTHCRPLPAIILPRPYPYAHDRDIASIPTALDRQRLRSFLSSQPSRLPILSFVRNTLVPSLVTRSRRYALPSSQHHYRQHHHQAPPESCSKSAVCLILPQLLRFPASRPPYPELPFASTHSHHCHQRHPSSPRLSIAPLLLTAVRAAPKSIFSSSPLPYGCRPQPDQSRPADASFVCTLYGVCKRYPPRATARQI
ncbi:hypothetical protein CSHISOI_08458 [Colletotrichum shisoi]|uniref:Uncharacterized protein n=1 Tax=Colletotrichum shisoi TaxID=2078593 RepID=A0A5Q4BJ61_9PEZI|nr:hypothetical protein CSHISOI_08458 [Colletotrichum shisoi]